MQEPSRSGAAASRARTENCEPIPTVSSSNGLFFVQCCDLSIGSTDLAHDGSGVLADGRHRFHAALELAVGCRGEHCLQFNQPVSAAAETAPLPWAARPPRVPIRV